MPFIGNQPALSYTSFAKQDFTTSATTSYTLDNPVANANELALFINFVRQEPTTAYSASGTTLTLTSATSSSDDMYCVYLGKAVQTVNPPNASVGASQIVDASITSGKLASGVLPTNTPAFHARGSSNQTVTIGAATKLTFGTEEVDTDNAFASSRFTVPSGKGGKYFISSIARHNTDNGGGAQEGVIIIYKNGSEYSGHRMGYYDVTAQIINTGVSAIMNLSAGDYIEIYFYVDSGSLNTIYYNRNFIGYKLIGS